GSRSRTSSPPARFWTDNPTSLDTPRLWRPMNVLRRSLIALAALALCPQLGRAQDVIYLDQGWSKELREKMYRIPQGSFLMPYSWFMALEQPYSDGLFRD